MKRPAILVVCVLLSCGGLFHLYLAAQVEEAEKSTALPFLTSGPITVCAPVMPAAVAFPAVKTPGAHPFPLVPVGGISTPAPPASSPNSSFQPLRPVAVAPAKTGPDISKFRLPIEYKLKNIPVESLIDFLTEEFTNVEAEAADEAGAITIMASLADHRTIKNMLVTLEREIATLRCEAANVAETAEQTAVRGVFAAPWDHPVPEITIFTGPSLQ